jgi:hypothetical protein
MLTHSGDYTIGVAPVTFRINALLIEPRGQAGRMVSVYLDTPAAARKLAAELTAWAELREGLTRDDKH